MPVTKTNVGLRTANIVTTDGQETSWAHCVPQSSSQLPPINFTTLPFHLHVVRANPLARAVAPPPKERIGPNARASALPPKGAHDDVSARQPRFPLRWPKARAGCSTPAWLWRCR
jgi:hypothetical protein